MADKIELNLEQLDKISGGSYNLADLTEKKTAIMAEEIREIKRQGFSKELSLELYRASMADYPQYSAQFNTFIDFLNANGGIIDP